MLLCVASGSSAEFAKDRLPGGSYCSSQSYNFANQQVMVEERCPMTNSAVSSDHVAAAFSLHLRAPNESHACPKEPSRNKVIVVGEDSAFSAPSNNSFSTTTTFKSNVVNGKRGINTILVRYKPSKPEEEDEVQLEFSYKNNGVLPSSARSSSPPSSTSSDSSGKKDKTSISAWAQIMELEGYRSPAIGLDNGPSKYEDVCDDRENDSYSNISSLSSRSNHSPTDINLLDNHFIKEPENPYNSEQLGFIEPALSLENSDLRQNVSKSEHANLVTYSRLKEWPHIGKNETFELTNQSVCEGSNREYKQNPGVSLKSNYSARYQYGDNFSKDSLCNRSSESSHNSIVLSPTNKSKSFMPRSQSSRLSKMNLQERDKSRRKTLPGGKFSLQSSNSNELNSRILSAKNQSPEHDPNASWGRYNSRAMRDSVRKVAEKYAETVYQRRQMRSKLDALPETKRIQFSRYTSPFNEHAHPSKLADLPKTSNFSNRASATSYFQEMLHEKKTLPNRLHYKMPTSTRHSHDMNITNTTEGNLTSLETEVKKVNQKQKGTLDMFNSLENRTVNLVSLNSGSDRMLQIKNQSSEMACADKSEIRVIGSAANCDYNSVDDRNRTVMSQTYSLNSTKNLDTNIPSIECQISNDKVKERLFVRMQDVKSKLCVDCSRSTDFDPPQKQSSCRSKHSLSDAGSRNVLTSHISLLKRAPLVISEPDSNPYLRSHQMKNEIQSANEFKKCTMLTASEMAELVHGTNNGRQIDCKVNQASVTGKVSSWIQKQKDKRKPVFFIGDSPSFFSEKTNETNLACTSKNAGRMSRRSLSLTSVREGEVSLNSSGPVDKPLNCYGQRLNSEDRPNEHKGLFIKRASSSCSNRGSARRKERQGSPAQEERKRTKGLFCHRNPVDGWNNRMYSKIKDSCQQPIYSNYEDPNFEYQTSTNIYSVWDRSEIKKANSFQKKTSELNVRPLEKYRKSDSKFTNSKLQIQTKNSDSDCSDIPNLPIENYDLNHSYKSVLSPKENITEWDKSDRPFLSKKFLHFKQITRALSLHSLKKKSKELHNRDTSDEIMNVESSYFSKLMRGSKRKNSKYGSLRKSMSYCELADAKSTVECDTKLVKLPETQISVKKPPVILTRSCSCSLRRSASLFWQFPLNQTQEYVVTDSKQDILAKIYFSRLHRRNSVLPFLKNYRKTGVKVTDFTQYSQSQQSPNISAEIHPLDYKNHLLQIQHGSVNSENDTDSKHKKRALNGKKKLQSSSAIMGLDCNYVLNEIIKSSNLSISDKYLEFDNSSDSLQSTSSISMNKDNTPIVLRHQTKTTSRSERFTRRKSAFEIFNRNSPKASTGKSEIKKRPSSQFYDIEELALKAEDESSFGQLNNVVSSSQPALCDIDNVSNIPQSSGLATKHLPLHTSTPHLSPAEGLLQRFRKSFAVRFKKKAGTSPTTLSVKSPRTFVKLPQELLNRSIEIESPAEKQIKQIQNNCISAIVPAESLTVLNNIQDPKKVSPNSLCKEFQRTYSNNKKRKKIKTNWRASIFYDSIDSILEPSFKLSVDKCLDVKQDVCGAHMDSGNPAEQQKNVTSLSQVWTSNPVKLCRVHSRLLMCRHKGRYRLRRSISQPVELEMTGSIHNLRESTHGSADHDSFQKGSLSSEDEVSSESEIYHSYCCSPTRRSNTCWELSGEGTMYAEALWDHETLDSEELPFQAGDVIEVTDTSDQDWWWGTKDGLSGWFPSAFVRLYVSHRGPILHLNGQQSDGLPAPYSPCKVNMNNLSCEQVRANIVREIVATERDFVKHLKDVVEGYLKQVHRRPDMFSKERIETVFGNIEEIFSFQSQFLTELEECLDKESPHLSQIGNCFLNHKEEFKMYSQYCNNHPLAVSELQELYCDSQYIHFFEACRLLQEMIDISLDGFLLTPIQRICKYPLQLAELLKFTDVNHPDHVPVSNALAAMKEVAELVNERKRRMECLERIAEWQSTIEGWEGPDVLDTSSILIHCGEVTRVSSSWSRDIYLFIFDHQLIYCKKDLLKRHTYAYKGRLHLDRCDIVDVEDGKDPQFTVNVKNAWKIYCKDKDKWYLFYAKTSPEKDQWLCAFKSERQRVCDDEKQAFIVTEEAKRSARLAVHNKQKPKRPRAKITKGRRCHPDVAVTELLLDSPSAKSRSGSLPSNIHPELAIMAGSKLGPTRKKGSGWFNFGSGKKPKS